MKLFVYTVCLLLSTSVFAQTVFFSDDFESGSLADWNKLQHPTQSSYTIIDDGSGNNVAELVHTKNFGRLAFGNNLYSGLSEKQCVFNFNVSVDDFSVAKRNTDFIIGTTTFTAQSKIIVKIAAHIDKKRELKSRLAYSKTSISNIRSITKSNKTIDGNKNPIKMGTAQIISTKDDLFLLNFILLVVIGLLLF